MYIYITHTIYITYIYIYIYICIYICKKNFSFLKFTFQFSSSIDCFANFLFLYV